MAVHDPVKEALSRRIAGEIVLSPSPGSTMRKWRGLMGISQIEVAEELSLSPSVISDYETGRRRSPGSAFIRRFVMALISIDESRGGQYIKQLSRITFDPGEIFKDIREFLTPVSARRIVDVIDGEVIVGEDQLDQEVYGYTVVDSLKAIHLLSGLDFYRIFGATSERALIFTGVSSGRSPMIAVKISPFKPSVLAVHGIKGELDPLAVSLAIHENILFVVSRLPDEDELVEGLLSLYRASV